MAPIYRLHRVGLGPVRRWATVRVDDTSPEAIATLDQMLDAATPEGRLRTIKARATQYPKDTRLDDEIEWVEARLAKSNGNAELADMYALTALERGLDLLHTQQYLQAVLEKERRRKKDAQRGVDMTKLPSAEKLKSMIAEMKVMGHGDEREVKPILAHRFNVGVPAINKKLRLRKKTD